MNIGESLQYRQSLFKNRVIYVLEEVIGWGTPEHATMGSPTLAVWVQVGRILPTNPQMMGAINA